MTLHDKITNFILENPGSCKSDMCRVFQLTRFRLNRALCGINDKLVDCSLVHSKEHGLWIVPMDPNSCLGVNWQGGPGGALAQCPNAPCFADGRCYEHTDGESLEMIAFRRELIYATGMPEPNSFLLSQLHITELEAYLLELDAIRPLSGKEASEKAAYRDMLRAAFALLRWKEMRQRRRTEEWIPHDAYERHHNSSINPFEFTARQYFVTLDLTPKATREEVLKAWRSLARKFHPDTQGGDEERMKKINYAKEKIFHIRRWT